MNYLTLSLAAVFVLLMGVSNAVTFYLSKENLIQQPKACINVNDNGDIKQNKTGFLLSQHTGDRAKSQPLPRLTKVEKPDTAVQKAINTSAINTDRIAEQISAHTEHAYQQNLAGVLASLGLSQADNESLAIATANAIANPDLAVYDRLSLFDEYLASNNEQARLLPEGHFQEILDSIYQEDQQNQISFITRLSQLALIGKPEDVAQQIEDILAYADSDSKSLKLSIIHNLGDAAGHTPSVKSVLDKYTEDESEYIQLQARLKLLAD